MHLRVDNEKGLSGYYSAQSPFHYDAFKNENYRNTFTVHFPEPVSVASSVLSFLPSTSTV